MSRHGNRIFIAAGEFPIELSACQEVIACAANWQSKLYLCLEQMKFSMYIFVWE